MNNRKLIAVSSVLAAVLLIPLISQAQRGGMGGGFGGRTTSLQSPIVPKNDNEKKIVAVLNEMTATQRTQGANVPMDDGRFLRILVESINAKNVVEIGTSNGYSALWMLLGLKSTGGKLTTFEIEPSSVKLARQNFKNAGVDNIATVVEGDAHEKVKILKEPIDLLFLDADKDGYLDYLNQLLPLVRAGGLIIAHNMDQAGTQTYINAVTNNADLDTLFINTGSGSVGVTIKKH
ncbi:MAG: O-methyltransferase [Deltaproteobacteria bacterium]|nr:O-methyltransferase [Deltaproteobacteria bacterium]